MQFQSKHSVAFLTPDELLQFKNGKQSLTRPRDDEMEMITLEDVECLPYDASVEIKKENFHICKLIFKVPFKILTFRNI